MKRLEINQITPEQKMEDIINRDKEGLSCTIARRFCDMVENKARGMYENFDAQTGKCLRAPGYSWTGAVHLVLMQCYAD